MQLNQFHIIRIKNTKYIVYDDVSFEEICNTFLEGLNPNLYEEWLMDKSIAIDVPFEQWDISDLTEVASNLLEDVNAHKRTNEPMWLLDLFKKSELPEQYQLVFFRNYVKELFDQYGY